MRWEDERYVRIYTRDTVDWLGLSFIAQGLFCLILRKVDRAGILKLGKHGRRAVAIVIGFPGEWSRLEPALDELIADGCVQIDGDRLFVPNFMEAQEAVQSDAQRQREKRARDRDKIAAGVTNRDAASRDVTECHENGQKVTSGHAESRAVTPAVPSRTEPSQLASAPASDASDPDAPRQLPPRVRAFRDALSEALGKTRPMPIAAADRVWDVCSELDLILAQHDSTESVVAACVTHALGAGVAPKAVAWFVQFLRELGPPVHARGEGESPRLGDPDFNDPDAWPTYEDFVNRGRAHA